MTRETAYYLDNMYKKLSRGLAILFINSMGIVMKWSTLKLRGGQSVLGTEGDATWSSLQEGKTWTEWDLASLLGTSRFWGDGCGVARCGVITGIVVEHRHGEPLLNPSFIRLREPLLWLPVSYGRRFSRRWRRLDGSATDLPPSNSIPTPLPPPWVPAEIVSTYYRKRQKLSHRTKILRSNHSNYETTYASICCCISSWGCCCSYFHIVFYSAIQLLCCSQTSHRKWLRLTN